MTNATLPSDAIAEIANSCTNDVSAYLAGRAAITKSIERSLSREATELERVIAGLDCAYAWQDQRDRRAADRTANK